jgi:uncharacterized protein
MTHLHRAAYNADVEAVRKLLAEGIQPDQRDNGGYTALLWASFRAAIGDQVPVIQALIQAGADPNAITGTGESNCLILAAHAGSEPAVAALVAGGANVDGQADGVTALMVAARIGETGVIKLLLRAGANAAIRCGSFTAVDYARYGGYDELADLLDKATRLIGPSEATLVRN